MRFLFIFYILLFTSFSSYATNISTIRLSYIINNNFEFKSFLNKLDELKINFFNELKLEEEIIESKKEELEDSMMLLNEEEYNKLLESYNIENSKHIKKINKYEEILNNNMNKNKNLVINEISLILNNYAKKNNIDIILNEDQYFISSSNNDISDVIIKLLNEKELNLFIEQ